MTFLKMETPATWAGAHDSLRKTDSKFSCKRLKYAGRRDACQVFAEWRHGDHKHVFMGWTFINMDQIKGTVNEIIDHNTFWMNVTWRSSLNKYSYDNLEKIQLSEDKSPEPGPAGATYITSAYLLNVGDHAHCNIQARDVYGRVVADVWKL